ncbi:MAG: hypothetical protein M3Q32_02545 [Pseudomonadota bacterium]|nr:hypothetical protein [Pseudomonadota bacterium]
MDKPKSVLLRMFIAISVLAAIAGCGSDGDSGSAAPAPAGSDGPARIVNGPQQQTGNAAAGQNVYRFATFGNERFWTDALRLQQGIIAANVTPLQALQLGLHVDVDAPRLPAAVRQQLAAELAADPSGATSSVLNTPANTAVLVSADAVIGLSPKDSNGDGVIDITNGDKTGATCALCHTITDASVFRSATGGGTIGVRQDGRATHTLDFGSLIALGQNSMAYYPVLQLRLAANGNTTLGRASNPGLTENSTEAEADAYLRDKASYPVGMFDDTVDGNGDPMHNMPLFEQDLAFPYGSDGTITTQDNFANTVYTILLDPTLLTTTGGRAFLTTLGGAAAGNEIVDDYIAVLARTGVTGPFPYVQAAPPGDPALAGTEAFPAGVRVDNTMLADMNAYLFSLPAPAGVDGDAQAMGRGRQLFRTVGCTGCHNVDQARAVPGFVVAMATIFPGDNPVTLLASRATPMFPTLNPILDTPGNIFDDKMAVVNATLRGEIRGTGLPLLLDLARKPVFLHDNSVPSLDNLLDQSRGANAPHPFYLTDSAQRADMVTFLRSLDTSN